MKFDPGFLVVLLIAGCVNNPVNSDPDTWEVHWATIGDTQLRISIPPRPRISKAASNYESFDSLDDQEVILFVGYESSGIGSYAVPQLGVMVRSERFESLTEHSTPEDIARILADRYNEVAKPTVESLRKPGDYEIRTPQGRTWLHISSGRGAAYYSQVEAGYLLGVFGLFGDETSSDEEELRRRLEVLSEIVNRIEITGLQIP